MEKNDKNEKVTTTEQETKKGTILSVDDEATNQLIINSYFKKDYFILPASNGIEALKIFNNHSNIDLILLDIMMPEMDGITTCEEIRKTDKGKEIPILFLSAKSDVTDIIKGLDKGGNDYITKPFRPAELKARVESQFKIRSLQKLKIQNENLKTIKNLMVRLNHEIRNSLTVVSATLRIIQINDNDKPNIKNMQMAIEKITALLKKVENLNEIKETDYVGGIKMLEIDP